jgi:cathepsin H
LNQYYPFTGTPGDCYFNWTIPAIQIYGLGFNFVNGEDNLKQAIFDQGPILASFEVAQDFIDYKDGIYSSDACNKGLALFNHTLLVVGYGQDPTPNGPVMYWIV